MNDPKNPLNVVLDNSTSFKCKASLLGKTTDADGNDRSLKNTRIVVPLKYLSNFFRSVGATTCQLQNSLRAKLE